MIPGIDVFTDGGAVMPSSGASARSGPVASGSVNFGNLPGRTRLTSFDASDNTVFFIGAAVLVAVVVIASVMKKA